jgi:hypothetical protein
VTLRTVFILFLPAICAAADLSPLIDSARSAPPEFAADALIRLAELDSLPRARRIELLEEAFHAGGLAQAPSKRHSALSRQEGPARFLNRAYDQELDALSLRVRAVEAALPLDVVKARGWFATIQPPVVPRLSCDDFLVYDLSRFYETLGRVVQSFPEQEKAKGDAFRLLRGYTAAITSPVQVAPLARVLTAAPVSDDDFVALISLFGVALGKISGDDRSFTYSRSVGTEIQALAAECRRRNVSPLPLLESYRFYLVTNLSAARCADDDQLAGGGGVSFGLASGISLDPLASDYIRFFNEKLRTGPLPRIGEEDATPARLEGAATGLRTCRDEECQSISKISRELVLTPEGTPYLPAQRNSEEWRKRFDALLEALANWKTSAQETPIEQFREKSDGYALLLNLAPDAHSREAVIHAEIGFLAKNPVAGTNRAEWLLPVNSLLGRIALDPAGFGKIAAELRESSDPVIALYARLDQVAPRRPEQILPLL